jgi:hypothetical protein
LPCAIALVEPSSPNTSAALIPALAMVVVIASLFAFIISSLSVKLYA